MNNSNALISMALVSKNADNPYMMICEYIKYCIFANPSDVMMLSEIKTAVEKEFGIYIPYNITIQCISMIRNEGLITRRICG